jgi:hypothetical protein
MAKEVAIWHHNFLKLLESKTEASTRYNNLGWSPSSIVRHNHLTLGEGTMLQDRHFFSVIKRRLRDELEHNPPLFPWENEVQDYPDDLWSLNLKVVQLPVALPQSVLEKLLSACQASIHTVSQKGRQLVQAVESFFPNDPQQLNDMAGMMLLGAARDEEGGKTWILGQPPQSYETASPQQQMALTLLAADQILFDLLSLDVSPHHLQASSHWETEWGTIALQASQAGEVTDPSLDLMVDLPCAGVVQIEVLQEDGERRWLSQEQDQAGTVWWTIPIATQSLQKHSAHVPIRVSLGDQIPTVPFILRWTDEADQP